MAVIDTSRDLPESCEKCWKKDCSIYGTEWMSILGINTYRNSRDKNCPLKSVDELKEDVYSRAYGLGYYDCFKKFVVKEQEDENN